MSVRREPVRIIYAKLTSTGSYDVVAKTPNIELSAARTLAEKLLPGNVPHGVSIEEDVGYVHPPEGGHLVFRHARYGWSGDNRGEIYMTDIVLLDDADFARARANAFAVLPRSDDVFETLTELPLPVIPERTAADDTNRLRELAPLANDAANLFAGALTAPPVLMLDTGDRNAKAELCVLLLPPALRKAFTFQTRAFRAPPFPPRLTLTDAHYASLHAGPWPKVLPDISVDVPIDLARRLTDLVSAPDRLMRVHALYDRLPDKSKDLRAEATRLAGLADFITVLESGSLTEALRRAAARGEAESAVMVGELIERTAPAGLEEAMLNLVDQGDGGHKLALLVLRAAHKRDARGAQALLAQAADRAMAAGRLPHQELLLHLVERLAAASDANRLVRLLSVDRRAVARVLPDFTDRAPAPIAAYLAAIRNLGAGRPLQAAAQLTDASAALDSLIDDERSRNALKSLLNEVIVAAVEKANATSDAMADVVALQESIDRLLQNAPRLSNAMPQLLSDQQLGGNANAIASLDQYPPPGAGAIAGALIMRAARRGKDPAVAPLVSAARAVLSQLDATTQKQVRAALESIGIRQHSLVELPGANELLPALGHDTQQAALTQQIVTALHKLTDANGEGVAQLAGAVIRARRSNTRMSRSHPSFDAIRAALNDACVARRLGENEEWPEVEAALDLLAMICDGPANEELELAALGKSGVVVRLRRLDRAFMQCESAMDPDIYERLARAVESRQTPLNEEARERLAEALGVRSPQRRMTRLIAAVMDKDAG